MELRDIILAVFFVDLPAGASAIFHDITEPLVVIALKLQTNARAMLVFTI